MNKPSLTLAALLASLATASATVAAGACAMGCAPAQAAPPPSSAASAMTPMYGPATPSAAPPPATTTMTSGPVPSSGSSPSPSRSAFERHVYKLDFVLTSTDAGVAAAQTAFTLNLEEASKGEIHVGKNVPLGAAPAGGPGVAPMGSPRQDVGLKVAADYRMMGDDILLEVTLEMSALEGGGVIRKITARGNALASPGKPTTVTVLDEDKKHYQLTVTATKVH